MPFDFSDEYKETLQNILSDRFSQVSKIYDIKARSMGERKFLEFRLEFKKEIQSTEYPKILGSLLDDLKQEFPYTEIIIYPKQG
ncbi:cation transporter dimerization domain-containing protein [Leptospira venezuelensis]|uniref:cation transporter dimerization domain-containing protein n=1 Tax=Leptospira venezuelensis TaxID=1958811 RepID=UPI000A3CDC5C|nr:cation transporter dimerization domain-containing protein [Leptospira venezuelensis]